MDQENSQVLKSIKNFFDNEAGDKIREGFDDVTATIKGNFSSILGSEANEIIDDVKSITTGTFKVFKGMGELLFKRNNTELSNSFTDDIIDLDMSITNNFTSSTHDITGSISKLDKSLSKDLDSNAKAISSNNKILNNYLGNISSIDQSTKRNEGFLSRLVSNSNVQTKKMTEMVDLDNESIKRDERNKAKKEKQKKGLFGFDIMLTALGFSIGYFESEINKAIKSWRVTVAYIVSLDWAREPFVHLADYLKTNYAGLYDDIVLKLEKFDEFLKRIGIKDLLEIRPMRLIRNIFFELVHAIDGFFGFSETWKKVVKFFDVVSDKLVFLRRVLNLDFLTFGKIVQIKSIFTGFLPGRLLGNFLSKFLEPILYIFDLFDIWTDDSKSVSEKILSSIEMLAYRVFDYFMFIPLLIGEFIVNPIIEWILGLFGVDIELPNWYTDMKDFFDGITMDLYNLFNYFLYGQAWDDFTNWISSITLEDILGGAITVLGNILMAPFKLIGDIFKGLWTAAKFLFYYLTPFGWVLLAAELLLDYFNIDIFDNPVFDGIKLVAEKFTNIGLLIKDALLAPFEFLFKTVRKIANDPNEKSFFQKLTDELKELWEAFKDLWSSPVDWIKNKFMKGLEIFGPNEAGAAEIPRNATPTWNPDDYKVPSMVPQAQPKPSEDLSKYMGIGSLPSSTISPYDLPIPNSPVPDVTQGMGQGKYGSTKPYTIGGQKYYPISKNNVSGYEEYTKASWYNVKSSSTKTANGEYFNDSLMTAAHKTLPINSVVAVTNMKTGQTEYVRINDRGPFVQGRGIDLSEGAAKKLGIHASGEAPVKIKVVGMADPFGNITPTDDSTSAMNALDQERIEAAKRKLEEENIKKKKEEERHIETLKQLKKMQDSNSTASINNTNIIAANSSGGNQGSDIPDTIENATMALANWCLT